MPRHHRIILGLFLSLCLLVTGTAFAADPPSPTAEREDPVRALMRRVESMEEELNFYRKEQEARVSLMPTEEDVGTTRDRTEDVLRASEEEAAKYVLLKQRTIEMRYSLSYSHSTYDKITSGQTLIIDIERESYYHFTNTLGISYGILPRLSVSASIPFVYKYQKTGDSIQETDLGDASLTFSWQLLREQAWQPSLLMSLGYSAPSGRSPFKIDIQRELSTGNGTHSFNVGLSLSKVLDPVIAFGGIGFGHSLDVTGLNQARYGYTLESVEPGHTFAYSLGMGFALSYTTSVTFRFQASHQARSQYVINKTKFESDGSSSASFVLGTGWRINPKTSLNVSLGYGLVGLEDYNIFVSIPFDFTL